MSNDKIAAKVSQTRNRYLVRRFQICWLRYLYAEEAKCVQNRSCQAHICSGLLIDLPKLFAQLKLIAYKDGQKVMDKQVDFDTLDLLTKRFKSKKKYGNLARTVFDDLNRLSEIPIPRTSKKCKKLGSGVVYYNDPKDLLERLELLGGSILAGNDGVKQEFSQIAHTLNKLEVITKGQLNDLVKEYVLC